MLKPCIKPEIKITPNKVKLTDGPSCTNGMLEQLNCLQIVSVKFSHKDCEFQNLPFYDLKGKNNYDEI
jgi:hypothetical protein